MGSWKYAYKVLMYKSQHTLEYDITWGVCMLMEHILWTYSEYSSIYSEWIDTCECKAYRYNILCMYIPICMNVYVFDKGDWS
jgi:hypothetical protein